MHNLVKRLACQWKTLRPHFKRYQWIAYLLAFCLACAMLARCVKQEEKTVKPQERPTVTEPAKAPENPAAPKTVTAEPTSPSETPTENTEQVDEVKRLEEEILQRLDKPNGTSDEELSELIEHVNTLTTSLQKSATTEDVSALKETIQANDAHNKAQLTELLKRITQLLPPQFLPVSMLPFKVLGLDYWNGIAKVTVTIGQDYALLMVGQQRAGWTLIDLNPESATAIFENTLGKKVQVKF